MWFIVLLFHEPYWNIEGNYILYKTGSDSLWKLRQAGAIPMWLFSPLR